MQSRVTIIITTFNRARSVSRAIDSALGQTHPNLDVIVVDDGSTDDTRDVLQKYVRDPRVRVLHHAHNRGSNAAKNTGLDGLADETAYFGLLDSDDALVPDGVARLVAVLDESGSAYSQVLGWCRDMETGVATGQMRHLLGREGLLTYEDALAGHFTGDFWHLARRDVLNGWRLDERASGGLGSLWWRMLRERPAWLSPADVLEVDRSGSDRLTLVRYGQEAAARRMWARNATLAVIGGDLRSGYPREYAGLLAELAKWAVLAGDGPRARAASRQAMRSDISRRTLLMALVAIVPGPIVRWAAETTKYMRLGGRLR